MSEGQAGAGTPRVWLVLAEKQGDNSQVEALASALDWPVERRHVRMCPPWDVEKPRVAATLEHLDLEASDALEPPWPDLILTSGRRTSMVALWIKQQSGGRTCIALIGKPSGLFDEFDLVIGSAEVQLPPLPNVLKIDLPLLRVDGERVARAAADWSDRLAGMKRPLAAFLIGGPTGTFVFNQGAVRRLLSLAGEVAAQGGTPYASTSRRTPDWVCDELEADWPADGRFFRWTPDAEDNPYLALLGAADGFVVTGDSVSMLIEVVRLGRPLSIFVLPSGAIGQIDMLRRSFTRWLFAPEGGGIGSRVRRRFGVAAFRAGLIVQTRDFAAMYRRMIERGWAVRDELPLGSETAPVSDDLAVAARRVQELVPGPG